MEYVLITGSASGLGLEFAKIYAKDGQNLILVDMNEEGLEKAKESLSSINQKIDVVTYKCDLSILDELKSLTKFLEEKNYYVSTLINSAGFGDREDFVKMNIEKQIKMSEVNCNALLFLCHYFGTKMAMAREGHIINVSSIAGFIPGPYMCTYHATKGYVLLLSESIGYELAKYNVKVLTLCPGPFKSNFVKLAHNDYTFKKIKPFEASEVALKAYKASKKGKRLLITGVKNKLTIFVTRLFPRRLVTFSSAKTMKE